MNKTSSFFKLIWASFFVITFSAAGASASGFKDEAFITDCMKEYIVQCNNTGTNAAEKAAIAKGTEAVKKKCLSSKFLKEWKKLGEETDADPLLNAQDFLESWKTQVRIKNFSEKDSSAKVYLGQGSEEYCLKVTFIRSKPHWKIDSSHLCSKN